jgi:DNA-binding winged helix-turn-helix (wHTH) protein
MKRTTRAKKVSKVDAETAEIVSIQLDVSTGSVRRGSDVVALRAKTLAVLQHLMERAGSIVGREELREKVWGKRHGNVDGPKQCVREIRAALHDVTKPPRFIETVGRRGYRFIGDLEVVGAEKNQDSPGLIPSATVRPTCVGREQELDGLANWLARARRGGRAICFLAGEPRAGKTTLFVLGMVPGLKGPFADRARADLRRISR